MKKPLVRLGLIALVVGWAWNTSPASATRREMSEPRISEGKTPPRKEARVAIEQIRGEGW